MWTLSALPVASPSVVNGAGVDLHLDLEHLQRRTTRFRRGAAHQLHKLHAPPRAVIAWK